MPNLYKFDYTDEEKIEEEDRECRNDLMRSQKKYYDTLTEINKMTLSALRDMSKEELKNTIRIPIVRI